jgi:Flp pilus assembly protein TadG
VTLNFPSARRHLPGSEHGSASVEFAASASVLFLTLIGLMNICMAIYSYHYVSEAAREGARFAIVRGSACTSFASACPAASSDVQTYVQSLGYPGIVSSNVIVTTTWTAYPTGTPCAPSTSPCNNPGDLARVKVSYAYPLSIPFWPSKTYTMTSTCAMVISQ